MVLQRRAISVEAFGTTEKMRTQLIAGRQVGARRHNHLGRGAAYSPPIWIGSRKMVLRGENQLLRVVKISWRVWNVCLRRRQIIVRCGVALHKPSFLNIFRLQLIEGMKRQKAPAREKKNLTCAGRRPNQRRERRRVALIRRSAEDRQPRSRRDSFLISLWNLLRRRWGRILSICAMSSNG